MHATAQKKPVVDDGDMDDLEKMIDGYIRQFPTLGRLEVAAVIGSVDKSEVLDHLRTAHERKVERMKTVLARDRKRDPDR